LFCTAPGPVFGAVTPAPVPDVPLRMPGLVCDPVAPLRDPPLELDEAARAGPAPKTINATAAVISFFIT